MPVSPRITAPGIQPPLGVASNTLPSLSMTEMWVVSFDTPAESNPRDASASASLTRLEAAGCSFAFQYGQVLTLESNGSGSPATKLVDARRGSIDAARCFAYAFESRPSAGTCTNAGSA